jgi:hypothetical protein
MACEEDRQPSLQEKVPDIVRRSQEVTPKIEFVPVDHYAGILKDYKFKRFRDERQREE